MKSKSCCNSNLPPRATKGRWLFLPGLIVAGILACAPRAAAGGDAPLWMRALVNTPLPSYDEKTDAVLLYSDLFTSILRGRSGVFTVGAFRHKARVTRSGIKTRLRCRPESTALNWSRT